MIVKNWAGLALAATVALSGASCSEAAGKRSAVDDAFGQKVRAYLVAHPEVIEEALEALKAKEEKAALEKARTSIGAHRAELVSHPGDPSLGAGPVTVVEFFDYRCTYCKAAAPSIPGLVADNKSIRLVFKEFPILTEISDRAARLALAAEKQGKYLPVHLAFMNEKSLDDAAIDRILKEKGVDVERAHTDAKSPEIQKMLDDNRALATAVGVEGTPAFIVGDKLLGGFQKDALVAEIKAQTPTEGGSSKAAK